MPQDLESRDLEKRSKAVQVLLKNFKDAVDVSNANIIRNANNLLTTLSPDSDEDISWIGATKQKEFKKFKLGY